MRCACVNCGEKATEGSMKHPYCEKCWTRIWKGKEGEYYKWLPYHDTILGMLWYKKNILCCKPNLWDKFLRALTEAKKK